MKGLLGKKIGMTEVFSQEGDRVPVTVLEGGPCAVVYVRTKDKDGYDAAMLGFEEKPKKACTKPELGVFQKAGVSPKRFLKELRLDAGESLQVGQTLEVDRFSPGEYVDVTSLSIGKGFQGGVKRWGWKGGRKTHGSMHHRQPGSIGASSTPSRVYKGHHLAGHMGNVLRTVMRLEVVLVDKENHLLLVRGAVPGKSGYVVIQRSKNQKRKMHRAVEPQEPKQKEKREEKPAAKKEEKKTDKK